MFAVVTLQIIYNSEDELHIALDTLETLGYTPEVTYHGDEAEEDNENTYSLSL